jgi:mannosyltransferase OCH1-like enzyme
MLNKVIWTYWYQGLEEAPPIVKLCVQEWEKTNPGWELILLNKDNLKTYVGPFGIDQKTKRDMSLAVSSDLIKLDVLIRYGGVWVDATTFPLRSLDEWIHDKMDAGFFYFYKPGRNRIISTWFIASYKNQALLKKLKSALIEYWSNNNFKNIGVKRSPSLNLINRLVNRNLLFTRLWFTPLFTKILRLTTYTITHFMFYNLLCKNKDLRKVFKSMPKIKPDIAHALSFSKYNYQKI